MPQDEPNLPGTLERSADKIQRTYEKTLDSAEEEYDGDEARAHRTAWASVKNVAEKRGDHWELKDETGPSDPRSKKSTEEKRAGKAKPSAESTWKEIPAGNCWSAPGRLVSTATHT